MSETKTKYLDFQLGSDPEGSFYSRSAGKIIGAGSLLNDRNNQFGVDGNGTTFEIRPSPSTNPLKLVMNIRNIFIEGALKNPKILEVDWMGGSFAHGYTHGGHIHFGYDKTKISLDQTFAAEFLSQYVGSLTLLIEEKEGGLNRRNTSYGGRKEIRDQSHGLEYRTPSSWITSPKVASGVLCLAKVVFSELLNNPESKTKYVNLFTDSDFKTMNTDKILSNFPEIWKSITQMRLYQQYKPFCDYIYWMIKEKLSWFSLPDPDLKSSWGILDLSALQKENSNITLELLWDRYKQSVSH